MSCGVDLNYPRGQLCRVHDDTSHERELPSPEAARHALFKPDAVQAMN